jgi:hypothetical protein
VLISKNDFKLFESTMIVLVIFAIGLLNHGANSQVAAGTQFLSLNCAMDISIRPSQTRYYFELMKWNSFKWRKNIKDV